MSDVTVIVPTVGRPSLAATLASIPDDWAKILVADGKDAYLRTNMVGEGVLRCYTEQTAAFGHPQRNHGISIAETPWLMFLDDDDVYVPDVQQIVEPHLTDVRPHVFRMRYTDGRVLWQEPLVAKFNVGTPMYLVPLDGRLGVWPARKCGDYEFLRDTVRNHGSVAFHEDVIALVAPNGKPAAAKHTLPGHTLVVARYEENTKWTAAVPDPWTVTVVQKGVDMPNEGREAGSYLHWIVENHRALKPDDRVAFVQGDPFTHCPTLLGDLGKQTTMFRWLGDATYTVNADGSPHHTGLPVAEWYERLTGRSFPGILTFAPGGQFITSGRALKRHKQAFYRGLLDDAKREQGPWVLERLWESILTVV